jgi:hypothetical protein
MRSIETNGVIFLIRPPGVSTRGRRDISALDTFRDEGTDSSSSEQPEQRWDCSASREQPLCIP